MIKIMFKPFFKKYVGLFVSMVFVSMLAIAMLCAFASTLFNLQEEYKRYLTEYENVDAVVKTNLIERATISDIESVEGVEQVDFRLTLDSRMVNASDRILTSRIFTFNESDNQIFKRYILEKIDKKDGAVNVSIIRRFAENNNLKLGDEIKVGYFKTYITLYINEIIETPEGIQARANDYVWSDTSDFGYIYISETELDKALMQLAELIDEKVKDSDEYKRCYAAAIAISGIDIPDLADRTLIGNDYGSRITNQLLIQAKEGYTEEEVLENVNTYLEEKGVEVKSKSEAHKLFYILYLENCIKQLRVASIFLPLFFYFVTMIVIGLFINQIIASMTKEIGVMMSVGVGYRDISSLFLLFTLLMSIIASIFGLAGGLLLNIRLILSMRKVYSMPTLPIALNFAFSIGACVALVIFSEITTLISCRGILRITPKDATISNEAKRKPLPKWLSRFIDKAPMNTKLGVNSIAQNFKRFFVSTFSIFASFVIILITLTFFASKTRLVNQSVNIRPQYDGQIYYSSLISDEEVNELISMDSITKLENCYYTYVEATKDGKSIYLECLAIDEASQNNFVNIPDARTRKMLKIEKEGIILPTSVAKELKVKKGDYISINGINVKVIALSNQYFHPITYLSKYQLSLVTDQYVTSILFDTSNEDAVLDYLDETASGTHTVFTRNLSKDIHSVFDSINVFIYIMVGFSFGMGLIILAIMSQNALMEQKRQLTILRAIGFTIKNVSDVWTLQSISELTIASIFAIPAGYYVAVFLFKKSSSAAQSYPTLFSIPAVIIAFAFILLIILLTHLFSMFSIKRWNIADNTRSRE